MKKTISYSVTLKTISNLRTGKESELTNHTDFESIALRDVRNALGNKKINDLNDLFISHSDKAYFAFINYEGKARYHEIPISRQYQVLNLDCNWCKKTITRNAEIKVNDTTIVEITRYINFN